MSLHSERVLRVEQSFDATEQFCHAIALWNECGYAEDFGQRAPNEVAIHRIDHDWRAGHATVKQRSDLHTIGSWHGKVEHDQIGIKGSRLLECFITVSGFANFKLRTMLDEPPDRASYRTVVISDKNSLRHE